MFDSHISRSTSGKLESYGDRSLELLHIGSVTCVDAHS
jgi:hypothetical protein